MIRLFRLFFLCRLCNQMNESLRPTGPPTSFVSNRSRIHFEVTPMGGAFSPWRFCQFAYKRKCAYSQTHMWIHTHMCYFFWMHPAIGAIPTAPSTEKGSRPTSPWPKMAERSALWSGKAICPDLCFRPPPRLEPRGRAAWALIRKIYVSICILCLPSMAQGGQSAYALIRNLYVVVLIWI